jgi:MAGUK p55 subfamily protein 5
MPLTDDSHELCRLLKKLNVKNILQTHDHVANHIQLATGNSSKTSSQKSLRIACNPNDENALLLNKAEHYSVENLKLVHIDKLDAPLGATIRNQDGSIVIGRIVKGSVADLSGLLHEDDEILEINSIPIRGKTINDVSDMLVRHGRVLLIE